MIYNGTRGTLCLYYKGLLISSFPLSNIKTVEKYLYQGEYLIRKSKGVPIRLQIKTYLHFCNEIYIRKRDKLPIYKSDHELFLSSLSALLRLRIIENDDLNGYMSFPKKKLL